MNAKTGKCFMKATTLGGLPAVAIVRESQRQVETLAVLADNETGHLLADEIVERLNSEGEKKEQICGMCGHFHGRVHDDEIIDGECRSDYPEVDKWTGFACHYKKVAADNPACGHFRKEAAR